MRTSLALICLLILYSRGIPGRSVYRSANLNLPNLHQTYWFSFGLYRRASHSVNEGWRPPANRGFPEGQEGVVC